MHEAQKIFFREIPTCGDGNQVRFSTLLEKVVKDPKLRKTIQNNRELCVCRIAQKINSYIHNSTPKAVTLLFHFQGFLRGASSEAVP